MEDNSVDFIISNCVINLSPSKPDVFREIYRVLKPGGRFAVSDIVLLADLPEQVRNDVTAYVGCVAGASPMHEYVRIALEAGLVSLSIPQIAYGVKLAQMLAPEGNKATCCSSKMAGAAATCIASIKLHGKKPE